MEIELSTPRVFLPLLQPSRYKGVYGGRGSGKSHDRAAALIEYCALNPGTRAVCVREVQKTLKESAKRLLEAKINAMGLSEAFDIKSAEIKTPGNGVIIFQGMQDHTAESIKSLEGFNIAWVEEAQSLSGRSLELLRPTIRAPGSEIWFTWNPRDASDPVDKFLRGNKPPEDSILVRANYSDNPFFPAELEAERRHDLAHNRDRYAHIWEGAYEPVAVGAIWARHKINEHRRDTPPLLKRIVVAVDPAVSSEPGSDEHGIIVCGVGEDGRGYVLDDASLRGAPRQWADRVVAASDRWEADAVIIERNQGGDMVRHTLEAARPSGLRILEVTATRGKHVRAEPISALYDLGRISHVGTFDALEDQMCKMTAAGYEGPGSPDRCDALVYAMTELFPTVKKAGQAPRKRTHPGFGQGGWMG
ncbi:MAG: PBSX family phage terminase large subunit [Rhodospirillaceae bacterium]